MSSMGAGSVDVRTAGGMAQPWPSCGLSATLQPWPGHNLWQPCQDGYWSPPHSSQALEASCPRQCPDPHCIPTSLATDSLPLSCTLGVSLWLAQSLCAISGLAKLANSSAMPGAELCLLHRGLNLVVCLSVGYLGNQIITYSYSDYFIIGNNSLYHTSL